MFLLRLALRNLVRNTRRTVLSLVAVVAGVAVLIIGQGFIGGLDENIIRSQVDHVSGHVMLRPADYPTVGLSHPVDQVIDVDPGLRQELDQVARSWTGRLIFAPRAIHGPESIRVRAIGFDPQRDSEVFYRDTWRVEGAALDNGFQNEQDGVLVSVGVARLLELEAGDLLLLETRTRQGAINALQVPVQGVFSAGTPVLDLFAIVMPLDLAREVTVAPKGYTHVAVRLPRREAAERVAGRLLERAGGEVEVVTWADETEELLEIQAIRRRALNVLVLVLLAMSATGIANTVLMAAYERVREIGTLRALGMTRSGVVRLFVAEGAFMGVVGGLVGALVGGGVIAWYARHGIDLSDMLEGAPGANIPISAMLYAEYSTTVIVAAFLFGVVVAILASIWPAMVASRMKPADAVRAD